jgi:hypothetical protein
MTISGANSASSVNHTPPAQSQPPAKPAAPHAEDSVQLSSAAKAATGGDVDHDGDSH